MPVTSVKDHASTGFQLKIKGAFHIQREQPSLNQQLQHVNLKTIFLILTLSYFTSLLVVTIHLNWHCSTYYIIQLSTLCTVINRR